MQLDPKLLCTVFFVIFVAELPDKTALAAVVLATRFRPLPLFFGAALALTVQSIVAVGAGGLLSLLPARPIHIGAGVLFLISAVAMWRRNDAHEAPKGEGPKGEPAFLRTLATAFGVVFLAEWGDLTQLGTAALAARYQNPLTVFCGATLALWTVTGIAIFVGNRAGAFLKPDLTKTIAAAVFAALGLALVTGVL